MTAAISNHKRADARIQQAVVVGAEVAWLEAGGEDSWRVYERVGYRPAGQRLYLAMNWAMSRL